MTKETEFRENLRIAMEGLIDKQGQSTSKVCSNGMHLGHKWKTFPNTVGYGFNDIFLLIHFLAMFGHHFLSLIDICR